MAVTGRQLATLAAAHIGEEYVNIVVPKDNGNWKGPWDCAEFASWLVYQKVAKLYGCADNGADPSLADAYSGAWFRDATNGTLIRASEDEAVSTAGVILVRKPPAAGLMGHIAVTDGAGRTIEAAGIRLGVRRDKVRGRPWHAFAKIPEITYVATDFSEPPRPQPLLLTLKEPYTKSPLVRRVQRALRVAGFDPGPIDGRYGPQTVAAVVAFQSSNRLVADGICGPRTAGMLGLEWPESRTWPSS